MQYKTLVVRNRYISFTTVEMQTLVAEYNCIKEQYMEEQNEVISIIIDFINKEKILKVVSTYYPALEIANQFISELDVLCSFSSISEDLGWKKPEILTSFCFYLIDR